MYFSRLKISLPSLRLISRRKYLVLIVLITSLLLGAWFIAKDADERYQSLLSPIVYDRKGTPISISQNRKGHYVLAAENIPEDIKTLLIKKEDRFFYYHPGVNPISTGRAIVNSITGNKAGGSSTITQQLAKNLLQNETKRNILNKLVELVYALSLELFWSKEEILLRYTNSVYLGNQTQGLATASLAYFGKPITDLSHSETISLLASLSHPSTRNPWEKDNVLFATNLNTRIAPDKIYTEPTPTEQYRFRSDSNFELATAGLSCEETCISTIDNSLTEDIRAILDRHIAANVNRKVKNGAVVVIKPETGELLAMIGSRDPKNAADGNQINMALSPRPIGSTIKPFIYAKGFSLGLRPYTLVEDREYKYPIATGFSLYPKNYDGQYRGEMTLHEALSNSYNVPAVKVLEYIGLTNFYNFLSQDLSFSPIQDFSQYQYGIALGGLEMDLLTLTHYFTIFPREGSIAPLKVFKDRQGNFNLPPQSKIDSVRKVFAGEYVALVNAILSDRYTGVGQFGLEGNLNLTQDNYGVKTGTSRDYHDSWVVGYTGDFVIGVWLGNSENTPLDQVSGSSGAGLVWHDVMEYLFSSEFNQKTPLSKKSLVSIPLNDSYEWGLPDDIVSKHQNILLEENLILNPHEGDVFEWTENLTIPLQARQKVSWTVDGKNIGTGTEVSFSPDQLGELEIQALTETGEREIITLKVILPE